ncbi:hypothetical protein ACFLUA_01130 [Chloroflexota bacterium]
MRTLHELITLSGIMTRFRNLLYRWVHAAILLLTVVLLVVSNQGASAEECTSACTPENWVFPPVNLMQKDSGKLYGMHSFSPFVRVSSILLITVTQTTTVTTNMPVDPVGTITPPPDLTATATLIPLPTITLQFPKATETGFLLMARRQPGSQDLEKQEEISGFTRLRHLWPFILLFTIWIVLGVWFIFSQLILD